jgi:hypothetical protein
MTAKQKAARARFTAAVAEAKKLRKSNPKLSQAEAVKKAWAILKHKKPGKRVAAIKIVERGESKNAKVKAVYQQQRKKTGKRAGLYAGVRRIAWVGSMQADQLKKASEHLSKWELILLRLEQDKAKVEKMPPSVRKMLRGSLAVDIRRVKETIKELRTHIKELKKAI